MPEISGSGMVLTARTISHHNKECLEIWLATQDGPVRLTTPTQRATSFIVETDIPRLQSLAKAQGIRVEVNKVGLKTFDQQPVNSLKFAQERQLHTMRRACQAAGITLFEADIKLADRFLMERFVTSGLTYKGLLATQPTTVLNTKIAQTPLELHTPTITNVKVKPTNYRCPLKVFSFDIECDEKGHLFSIGIASKTLNQVFIVDQPSSQISKESNCTFNTHESNNQHKSAQLPASVDTFVYSPCPDETSLLTAFIQCIQQHDPDILIGWNIKQFDLPVLHDAATRLNIPLTLGRHHSEMEIRRFEDNRAMVEIPGRAIIDGIEGLKTMTFQFESFALDNVATELLGKQKLIHDEDKLGAIKNLFEHDKPALTRYNFQDCVLVQEIAEHVDLIDFLILRSELTGLRLGRPGGSVASFINLYLPKLHRAGYISPNRPADGGLASPGGYVMSSKPGLYDNVLVLDFKSLYPSIIRTFKIDPLGLTEGLLAPEKAIPGFKNAYFHRDKHFLPDIITSLWQQRDEAKRQQDKPRSQAIKILMNSFYGVLGSGGCPFYDTRLASSITMRGHEIMQTTAKWIKEQGYDVIYGDTDSTFVHIQEAVTRQQARAIGKQLQDDINQRWQQEIEQKYALKCELEIEFETHYSRFFMPTIRGSEAGSKKRYAGLIIHDDLTAKDTEEIVFKGLENVRSDWTVLAKEFQEELYYRIFHKQPIEAFIADTVAGVKKGHFDQKLIYAKQLRKPLHEYTKTAPPHVKAARHADENNAKLGKPLQYQKRTVIRYVMTTAGPQVPVYQTHPLDYEHYIDKQIRPIADSILPVIGKDFDAMASQQMGLF